MSSPSKFRRAVGIKYAEEIDETPIVAVKGEHAEADSIVRIARRFGVAVKEDAALARACDALAVDSQIPESLFEAVAVLLQEIQKRDKEFTGA